MVYNTNISVYKSFYNRYYASAELGYFRPKQDLAQSPQHIQAAPAAEREDGDKGGGDSRGQWLWGCSSAMSPLLSLPWETRSPPLQRAVGSRMNGTIEESVPKHISGSESLHK